MRPYARGENRQQNSGAPVRDTAVCVLLCACTAALIPFACAMVLAATLSTAGFYAGSVAARLLVRTWRWATACHDWDGLLRECTKDAEFTLAGLPVACRRRFKAELLGLCAEMAREAARADREHYERSR